MTNNVLTGVYASDNWNQIVRTICLKRQDSNNLHNSTSLRLNDMSDLPIE